MTRIDLLALFLSFAYAFILLVSMEALGKKLGWSAFFTRKLIHIGAGMWIWPAVLLFDHWYIGILPFAVFIFLNYLFHKKQTFTLMEGADRSWGTVYFAFSITVLLLLFWRNYPNNHLLPIAVAATMSLTWGDAFAAIIGYKWGKHAFSVFGRKKTLEGTFSFFIFSTAALSLSLYFSPYYSPAIYETAKIIYVAVVVSAGATLAEAFSPFGTDNLFIPLVAAALLLIFL